MLFALASGGVWVSHADFVFVLLCLLLIIRRRFSV